MFEIPQDLQVSRAEWPEWATREASGRTIDPELPTRRFEAALDGSGAGWVSLLDAFRDRYRHELYFENDPHWTEAGHRLAAEVLAPLVLAFFEEHLLRP